MKYIIILLIFFLIPLVFANTTFFDQDDAFIMSNSATISPTGEVIGGTTGETTDGTTSDGSCLTNWICSSWSPCIDGMQIRNCAKEKIECYANLKKKPAENQSCSLEIKKNTDSEGGNLISQSSPVNFQNIIIPVIGLIVIIGITIFFTHKRHKKRKHHH